MPSFIIDPKKKTLSRKVKGCTLKQVEHFGSGKTVTCCLSERPVKPFQIYSMFDYTPVKMVQIISSPSSSSIQLQTLFVTCPSNFNATILKLENGTRLGYLNAYRSHTTSWKNWLFILHGCLSLYTFGGIDNGGHRYDPIDGIILTGNWNIENFFFGREVKKRTKAAALLVYILRKFGLTPTSDAVTNKPFGTSNNYICFSSNMIPKRSNYDLSIQCFSDQVPIEATFKINKLEGGYKELYPFIDEDQEEVEPENAFFNDQAYLRDKIKVAYFDMARKNALNIGNRFIDEAIVERKRKASN